MSKVPFLRARALAPSQLPSFIDTLSPSSSSPALSPTRPPRNTRPGTASSAMATSCVAALLQLICQPVAAEVWSSLRTAVTNLLASRRRKPEEAVSMAGGKDLLSEIRKHLRDDRIGIIGIYGMGGVGKTTLLMEINNRLRVARDSTFDVVVWATVSRDMDVFKIQEVIGSRIGFSPYGGGQRRPLPVDLYDRALCLYEALYRKRFLLLLDDLWEALDLEAIGIPRPSGRDNESKIVFTTRSGQICRHMDAERRVRVAPLDDEQSWALFCSNLGGEVDVSLRPLAKSILRKCGGLPLTLITVARAMSGARSIDEWHQAAQNLDKFPSRMRGMTDVLSILKFSLDRLEDVAERECLLYCSLFPEDYAINVEKLVLLWTAEGFLDRDNMPLPSSHEARMRGHMIIEKLKNACLLEGIGDDLQYVKIHAAIRDMALWVTGKTFRRILGGFAAVKDFEDAKRISVIMQDEMFELPCPARECPNLITFLVFSMHPTRLGMEVLPQSFAFMRALRVLDLSGTDFTALPIEIGLLKELRCLYLGNTRIRGLPRELGNLLKLRLLDLTHTRMLSLIPRAALATLRSLQALDLSGSGYDMRDQQEDDDDDLDGISLRDLESDLAGLEELRMDIYTRDCLDSLADSHKLQVCTRGLQLRHVANLTCWELPAAFEKLTNLERLVIFSCPNLEGEWKMDGRWHLQKLEELELWDLDGLRGFVGMGFPILPCLRRLQIHDCSQLKDLTCVGLLPRLTVLHLSNCCSLEELLQLPMGEAVQEQAPPSDWDGDNNGFPFPALKVMYLEFLTALRSISSRQLLFPSLKVLSVVGCPLLKRLPLGLNSGQVIREITCEWEWWEALEWDDHSLGRLSRIQEHFRPCLNPYDGDDIPK